MATPTLNSPVPASDRKGIFATVTGIAIAAGAFFLASACCWAPALILSLGLGGAFAAFLGVRWYIVAVGIVLALGGIAWQARHRRQAACACDNPTE